MKGDYAMKKALVAVMAICLILVLGACGNKSNMVDKGMTDTKMTDSKMEDKMMTPKMTDGKMEEKK
jgi:major membrane immunogen (membrane-anchored lipoprotein)